MRKTSYDGGDSTSVTSGVDNEMKKSAMKPKKSSLKRKPPNFSQESDDTVNEPLLQKDKAKPETSLSAKIFTKGKTDSLQEKETDKTKLLNENILKTTTTGFCGTTESLLSVKDSELEKTISVVAPIHNYMNTNVFNTHDNAKVSVTGKNQMLIEIDGTKQSGYSPSPLIFTTAKIHTDGKSKDMEPVQVTPVPILSTIEVSVSKQGIVISNEKKISNGSSVINAIYSPVQLKAVEANISTDNKGITSNLVLSPSTNKDTSVKTVTTTSVSKLSNNTLLQRSSNEYVPSSSSKSLSMVSNSKDKSVTTKDIKKEAPKFDIIKNDVMAKTTSSSGKTDISDISSKPKPGTSDTDKYQLKKLQTNVDNTATDSSINPLNIIDDTKSATFNESIGIPNTSKSGGYTASNKYLQRQKTTTDETDHVDLKSKPNVECSFDKSAKMPSFTKDCSLPKVTDSIFSKHSDKLPITSAKDSKNIVTTSTLNNTANSTSNTISTLSTKTTDKDVCSSVIATVKSEITSKISTTTTSSALNAKLPVVNTSSISKKMSTHKSPVVSLVQPVPSKDNAFKASVTTIATAINTSSACKTTLTTTTNANTSVSLTKNIAEPIVGVTDKTATTNIPPTTTSTKLTSESSKMSTITKKSPTTAQVTIDSKLPVTKSPTIAITTMATTSTVSKTTTSSNVSSSSVSSNTKSIPSTNSSTVSKTNVVASTATSVKSPNNNTSIPVTTKALNALSKTGSPTSEAKAPKSDGFTGPIVKSPQGSSAASIKELVAAAKKPTVMKTQIVSTKSPPVSSIDTTTSKIPSLARGPSTITKKSVITSSKTAITKPPPVTSSVKTPSTSVSNKNSNASVKTTSSIQANTNKSEGVTSTAASSSTTSSRKESIKKDNSKSREKDGKT